MNYPKRKVVGLSTHSDPRNSFNSAKVMQSEKGRGQFICNAAHPKLFILALSPSMLALLTCCLLFWLIIELSKERLFFTKH